MDSSINDLLPTTLTWPPSISWSCIPWSQCCRWMISPLVISPQSLLLPWLYDLPSSPYQVIYFDLTDLNQRPVPVRGNEKIFGRRQSRAWHHETLDTLIICFYVVAHPLLHWKSKHKFYQVSPCVDNSYRVSRTSFYFLAFSIAQHSLILN